MDIVYPLKDKSPLYEIERSIASVKKHLKGHGKIYVLGTQEVDGAELVTFPDGPTVGPTRTHPVTNTFLKCLHACDLTDLFIFMHDDIYIQQDIHVDDVPLLYKGYIPKTNSGSLGKCRHYLESVGATLYDFELHAPFPVVSEVFKRVMPPMCSRENVQWRSLYGNLCGFPAKKHADNKAFKSYDSEAFFVSSANKIHPRLMTWLDSL